MPYFTAGQSPDTIRKFKGAMVVGTANALAKAIARSTDELPQVVRAMGKALDLDRMPSARLRGVNEKIAANAQAAIVSGWRERLPLKSPSYRPGDRLTNKLGPALASPGMISGTSDRVISFINEDTLDLEARHWKRVNFGSMGPKLNAAGGHEAETYTIGVNGTVLMSLHDSRPARGPNYLPRNFGWDGLVMTNPVGHATPRGTGARAAHFTDLGLKVVARQFGPAYDNLFHTYIKEKGVRDRLKNYNINLAADLRFDRYGGWTTTTR